MDLGCPNTVLGVQIRVLEGFDQNLMEYKGLMEYCQNTYLGVKIGFGGPKYCKIV